MLQLAILLQFGLGFFFSFSCADAHSSAHYKSVWVPPEKILTSSIPFPNQGMGKSLQSCSFACTELVDTCPAFLLDDQEECTVIEDLGCSYAYGQKHGESNGMAKVMYNVEEFELRTDVFFVFSYGHMSGDYVSDVVGGDCSAPFDTEYPLLPKLFNEDEHPVVVPYKRVGVFAIGGAGVTGKRAQYWMPGETEWTLLDPKPSKIHNHGAAVSLDNQETIFAAGHYHTENGETTLLTNAEIFEGGSWTVVQGLPEPRADFVMIAKNDNEIYVFGGLRPATLTAYFNREPVFKYDRLEGTWTALAEDMPRFGRYPSCGKANLDGKDSVICLGSLGHDENQVDVFDFETEQWTIMAGVTGTPSQFTFGSLVVSMGTKLYKIRGQTGTDILENMVNKIDVFDLEAKEWVETIDVDSKNVQPNNLFILHHEVIIKKDIYC